MNLFEAFARDRVVQGVTGVLVAVAAVLVASTLAAPDVPEFEPTPLAPGEVGDRKVGPRTVTVDASSGEAWRFFDFSRGSVVEDPGPLGWDLAFRRFGIGVNGGAGFAGRGGAASLGSIPFDSVRAVPAGGYAGARSPADSVSRSFERWYDYSWTSHLLTPRPEVYAVRTADGRHAKLELLGYYCTGARPGCVTFRYVYQGAGGVDVSSF